MATLRAESNNAGFHFLIWGLLLAIPVVLFHNITFSRLSHNFFLVSTLYHIGLFYLNAYFLYPRLLTKTKWWLYIIAIGVLFALSYHVKLYLLELDPGFRLTSLNHRVIFFGPVPFLLASIIFRVINDRNRRQKLEKEARAEQLSAELRFLRSQVSPHFLFNVMTNMVSLARQKSDLLEPSLMRLSDLLRYMLYETGEDKFSVRAEINYLEDYIALQQLRFGEDVDIQLELNIAEENCSIEPMLLIPFVENAFKHGIGLVENPFIKIFLQVKEGHLLFRVMNNYNKQNISKDKSSGIGLANIKKRLSLLYSGKYNLCIKDSDQTYTVELNLDLVC